jgi:hypothetical protein
MIDLVDLGLEDVLGTTDLSPFALWAIPLGIWFVWYEVVGVGIVTSIVLTVASVFGLMTAGFLGGALAGIPLGGSI